MKIHDTPLSKYCTGKRPEKPGFIPLLYPPLLLTATHSLQQFMGKSGSVTGTSQPMLLSIIRPSAGYRMSLQTDLPMFSEGGGKEESRHVIMLSQIEYINC